MIACGVRKHCGGLKESLQTLKYITINEFLNLLPSYHYYGYDKRCHHLLFIADKFRSEYTWLFIEIYDDIEWENRDMERSS